ncbi:MAG: hypothetical protein RIS64_4326 [Bacteroidota bacterium]|jgi:hypothetical protein
MPQNLCTQFYSLISTFDKNGARYTKCPYRKDIYYPENKPEEKVRIALLYYLSSISSKKFDVSVEKERFDITITNNTIGELINYASPALIIETKREEVTLLDHKDQLIQYMQTKSTSCGLLFSCCEAFFVENKNAIFIIKSIGDIEEVNHFVQYSIEKQREELKEEIELFKNAKNGSFEDFKHLASKYRRGKRIKFLYSDSDGQQRDAEGHLFDFQNPKLIYFNYCGQDTRRDKRPVFKKENFIRLSKIYRFEN